MATVNQIRQDRRKGVNDAYKATRLVNSKVEALTRFLRNLKNNRIKIPEGKDWEKALTLASQLDSEVNSLVQTLSAGTQLYTTVQ
jgi:hypothetical protein